MLVHEPKDFFEIFAIGALASVDPGRATAVDGDGHATPDAAATSTDDDYLA